MHKLIHSRRTAASLLVAISIALPGQLQAHGKHETASEWKFSVGVGLFVTPNYTGDDDKQLIMAPTIRATDDTHWTISVREGVQYTINPGKQAWQWGWQSFQPLDEVPMATAP